MIDSYEVADEHLGRLYWEEPLPTEGECSRCRRIKPLDDLDYDRICLACQAILDIEFLAGHQLEGFRVKP